jgi:TrmH family RNA methyltransferase
MTMPKSLRQEVRQLKRRNARWETRKVMVEGEKCIRELCESTWQVERIYFTPPWKDAKFWESADCVKSIPRLEVSAKDMEMMSAFKSPPGMLAVSHVPDHFNQLPDENGMVLYLDNLSDPGNVGTLIRVADWFGLSGVVVSAQSADPLSPKTIQSAMGSVFHVPVCVCDWGDVPTALKANVVGLDAGGENLFQPGNISTPTLLVVGSESHGLSDEVRKSCNAIASIPGAGRAESLNASVAGAVAVASLIQQRVALG